MSRKAAFIDRDGTLIYDRHYLADPEQVELLPGAAEGLRLLRRLGYALVVVTNQSGIARGRITQDEYDQVAARLDAILEAHDAAVDLTLYCPHHPDFTEPCECRKPGLGMYRKAAAQLDLDLARSLYIGDKLADVQPAVALGGAGWLVRTGYGASVEHDPGLPAKTRCADDLADVATQVSRQSAATNAPEELDAGGAGS